MRAHAPGSYPRTRFCAAVEPALLESRARGPADASGARLARLRRQASGRRVRGSASWPTLHVHRRHGRACCGDFSPGSRRWTSPAELPAAGQVDGGEVLPRFARQHGQHSGPHQASLRHGIPTGALSDGAVHTEQAHHVPANVASFKEHQWAGSKDCGLLVAPHLIRVRVVKIAYWWCGVFIEATFRHGYFWLGTSSHSTSARARPVTRKLGTLLTGLVEAGGEARGGVGVPGIGLTDRLSGSDRVWHKGRPGPVG
jgi:hypothetical protein